MKLPLVYKLYMRGSCLYEPVLSESTTGKKNFRYMVEITNYRLFSPVCCLIVNLWNSIQLVIAQWRVIANIGNSF